MKNTGGRTRTVYFPNKLFEVIGQIAREEETSFSLIVVRLVQERLKQVEEEKRMKSV